jgi:hypothetical protein
MEKRSMKGSNTISMNEATVMEALQEYLDKRSTDAGKVYVIGVSRTGASFNVSVSETQPEPADVE